MKLFYFFLCCFTNGMNPAKGQLHQNGGILLRFVFRPYYDFFGKSCCKFSSFDCLPFVDSRGFVSNAYKGRIETYHYSGTFAVQIFNVRVMDAGRYRCALVENPDVYMIFQVNITGSNRALNPTLAFSKSTISPVSSAHNLLENLQETSNNQWRSNFTLGAISVVVVIILVLFITLGLFCYKKKSRDKCGTNVPSSPNVIHQPPHELIYTTVDFKHHQKTSNVYENLDITNPVSDVDNAVEIQASVEYATISRLL